MSIECVIYLRTQLHDDGKGSRTLCFHLDGRLMCLMLSHCKWWHISPEYVKCFHSPSYTHPFMVDYSSSTDTYKPHACIILRTWHWVIFDQLVTIPIAWNNHNDIWWLETKIYELQSSVQFSYIVRASQMALPSGCPNVAPTLSIVVAMISISKIHVLLFMCVPDQSRCSILDCK